MPTRWEHYARDTTWAIECCCGCQLCSAAPVTPPGARAPPPVGYVRPRHVAWAELLRRTFALDVLACSDCGGRLRLVATIAEPRVIARILAHLGLPLEPPRPVPPRQPSWLPAAS